MANLSINSSDVRRITQIDSSVVSDTDINNSIANNRIVAEDFFNVKLNPTIKVDFCKVIYTDKISVRKTPLLSVMEIKHNNANLQLDSINFNSVGTIRRDFSSFYNRNTINNNRNMVYVKYFYGYVDVKDEQDFLTTDIQSGDNVNITVSDSSNYEVNDYIRIMGFDGNIDIGKVTTVVDGTTITVDKLYLSHETGSIIEIFKIPNLFEQFILYESCIETAIGAIGGTYTFNTSYSKGGVSVNKGVPYPHFEKVLNECIKQRNIIRSKIEADLIR